MALIGFSKSQDHSDLWPWNGTRTRTIFKGQNGLYDVLVCFFKALLCSSGSNVRGESRALEGHCVSLKSPSRVRDGDEGVAGRNGREKYFPQRGVIDYFQKGNRKN